MIKKQAKKTLADKIAGVLTAVPAQFDGDEDHLDDTAAKLTEFDYISEDQNDDEELLSKFRKQNIDLLEDVDERYAGKKGNRKSLKESSDEFSDAETSSIDDEGDSDISKLSHNEENIEDSDQDDSQQTGSDLEESSGASSEDLDNEDSLTLSDQESSSFQHIKDTNISQQVKKGLSVRNQMNIWENLLEMRLHMQKCLLASNKMPQDNYYKEMLKESDSEMDFKNKVKETKGCIGSILDKLMLLQTLLVKSYPETKNLGKKGYKKVKDVDDENEEIPSDTDEEQNECHDKSEVELEPKIKKRKLNDYERDISDLFEKYRDYRNDTIEKWNFKTRLSVTKNIGQTNSVVSQIQHILADRPKLIKKTQLKKSEFNILGHEELTDGNLNDDQNNDVKSVEEYNANIFDDSDFYHQLLRELIEVKSADITDPVQLGRQWIQLQNLRSKMKRKIDTRATKGRKIRYAVHTKLVNFMAPFENHTWTEEAKNELYSSLFGKQK